MIEADRIISAELDDVVESHSESSIRPLSLQDYIGQPTVSKQLDIFIQAALARGEALDHVLILAHQV